MQSSNSILVYLGANAHKKLVHQLKDKNSNVRFLTSHIFPELPRSLCEDEIYNDSFLVFDESINNSSGEMSFTKVNDYNLLSIIDEVMDDKQIPLLWTRFNSEIRRRNKSEVKRYEVVYSLIKSSIKTCLSEKPSSIVFSYEPHMLPVYIFKRVAEKLNIKIYTLTISPFVWRLFCEGREGERELLLSNEKYNNHDVMIDSSVKNIILEKQSLYSVAKPFFEKRDVKNKKRKNILKSLKVNSWNPKRALLGYFSSIEYQKITENRKEYINEKYISIFLQYQPEQTTLPDGGVFVHSLFAIQMIYSAISKLGLSLVIREHPATLESIFDPKWRPKGYYQSIKDIGPGIYFDDINEDPFTLVENSVAIASINGSVLLEALLRGKPAIAFGKHALKGIESEAFIDSFKNEMDLKEKIERSSRIPSEVIVQSVEKYLYGVYSSTFGSDSYPGNDKMTLESLREARCDALVQVVSLLSKNMCANE